MRNQRLGATRMRNQRFGIYIQMSTLIQKFSLRNVSDFRVFPNLQLRIFKKIKNDFFLNFLNLYQVETTFGAWYIQRYNQTLQRTSSIVANPQLSGPIRNIYTFYFRNEQKHRYNHGDFCCTAPTISFSQRGLERATATVFFSTLLIGSFAHCQVVFKLPNKHDIV